MAELELWTITGVFKDRVETEVKCNFVDADYRRSMLEAAGAAVTVTEHAILESEIDGYISDIQDDITDAYCDGCDRCDYCDQYMDGETVGRADGRNEARIEVVERLQQLGFCNDRISQIMDT